MSTVPARARAARFPQYRRGVFDIPDMAVGLSAAGQNITKALGLNSALW